MPSAPPPIVSSQGHLLHGLSASELAQALWKADFPEEFIKCIPAQSLFLAIKERGLRSSADIISIATIEQCRCMLDLDCWEKDRFSEEQFFEWLALSDYSEHDPDEGLEILQKLLKSADLRLIGLLVARHVHIVTCDEPTAEPPAPGYYTPDKGSTWILINAENADRHFYLGKLLALLFETSAEIFYQVLSTPQVATESMLEEDSLIDRHKRLVSLGVPDGDTVAESHAALPLARVLEEFSVESRSTIVPDVDAITPLVYSGEIPQPLATLLSQVGDIETFEREFSFLINGAIVRWGVSFPDFEQVMLLARKVRGAINIGLEAVIKAGHTDVKIVYERIGLQKLYRVGLAYLFDLRKQALKITQTRLEQLAAEDSVRAFTIQCCREPFPEIPTFVGEGSDGSPSGDERLSTTKDAIASLEQIQSLRSLLLL